MNDVAAIQKRALDYAETNRLALFTIDPATRNGSLYDGHGNRFRWEAAFAAGMHLGVSAINSDCLLFDVDVHGPEDREEAWQHYLALCEELRIKALPPYAHSKSGGWHFAFRAPPWFKTALRKGHHRFKISHFRPLKPGEVDRERISIRWRALNVYAGSVTGNGVYQLTENTPPPHPYGPDTAALFDWYATLQVGQKRATIAPPTDDCLQSEAECVKLERFVSELMLKDPRWFEDRDNRLGTVWGIKRAGFGIRGYEIAGIICDVTPDEKSGRLDRYWYDAGANKGTKTLASFWKRCADVGIKQAPQEIAEWRGEKAMTDLTTAAAALAKPRGANSLVTGRGAKIDEEGRPIVAGFNMAHEHVVHAADAPTLPLVFPIEELRGPLTQAIGKMITLADEQREALKFDAIADMLGVLGMAHPLTFENVIARVRQTGAVLPEGKLNRAVKAFEVHVERALREGVGFRMNKKGDEPDPANADNVAVLLSLIGADVRFNVWTNRAEIRWKGKGWVSIDDAEINRVRRIASTEEYRFRPTKDFMRDMIEDHARDNRVDPVLDRIDGFVWDGVARLDSWLARACHVPNDAYHRAVGRNVIGGIVKRARRPGAKHDEIMLLMGETGLDKSTAISILALESDWFTDRIRIGGRPQDVIPQMAGKLVIELGELAGLKKADSEEVKAFITTVNDQATLKYKAYASDQLRRCIFVGSTNEDEPLIDPLGNRRYLPVRVTKSIDTAWLRENVEQLLAEAAVLESKGETFGIPRNLWSVAAEHQEAARRLAPAEEIVSAWFTPSPEGTRYYVLGSELTAALMQERLSTNWNLSAAFKALGYEQRRPYVNGRQVRVWITKSDMADKHVLDSAYQWKWARHPVSGRVEWKINQPTQPPAHQRNLSPLPPPPY